MTSLCDIAMNTNVQPTAARSAAAMPCPPSDRLQGQPLTCEAVSALDNGVNLLRAWLLTSTMH